MFRLNYFFPYTFAVGALSSMLFATHALASSANPDISLNFLSLYENHNKGGQPGDGLGLQEAEMQFFADVDPYWRANALLSVSKGSNGEYGISPEEVFAETIAIPAVAIKVGKFKAAMGRHNQIHTHAYPFIDGPLINSTLLGEEGLNEPGVSAAYLIPTGSTWFSEFTLQALKGDSETLFNSPTPGDIAGLGHWKNLVELSDSLTTELGLSSAVGRNSASAYTSLFGADLTFKYRPVEGGKYHSLVWATEYLNANRKDFADETSATGFEDLNKVDGLATWLLYQFAERWSTGARYDIVGLSQKGAFDSIRKTSGILAFNFSEFSQLRAQYDYTKQGSEAAGHHVALQLNITIGAHPAHAY